MQKTNSSTKSDQLATVRGGGRTITLKQGMGITIFTSN